MADDANRSRIDREKVPRWCIVREKAGRFYDAAGNELPSDRAQIEDIYRRRYGLEPVIQAARKPRVLR